MQQAIDFETWKRVSLSFSRLKSDPILRAVLPRNYTGCLMGFGGQVARKLQHELNVYLQIHEVEKAKWGRVISVKGSPARQSRAWYECAVILLDNYYSNFEELGFYIDFIFPTELVDLFILQNDFQRIATASHTKIMVKHKCLMRSTERVVRVHTQDLSTASLKCFQDFVYMISELVNDNLGLMLCSSGNIFYIELFSDNILGFMKSDTEKDLVFYPRVDEDKLYNYNTLISDDNLKRDGFYEIEQIEQFSGENDLKGRESGNSSYYDAISEKEEFEESSFNENEEPISETNQSNINGSSQTTEEEEKTHQYEKSDEDHINEIDQGADEIEIAETICDNEEETDEDLCNYEIREGSTKNVDEIIKESFEDDVNLEVSRKTYSESICEQCDMTVEEIAQGNLLEKNDDTKKEERLKSEESNKEDERYNQVEAKDGSENIINENKNNIKVGNFNRDDSKVKALQNDTLSLEGNSK